jgi:hypothetical protein
VKVDLSEWQVEEVVVANAEVRIDYYRESAAMEYVCGGLQSGDEEAPGNVEALA